MPLEEVIERAERVDQLATMKDAAAQLLTASIVITTQEEYEKAGEYVRGIDMLKKDIIAHHAPIKKATHAAWKLVIATESEMLVGLDSKRLMLSRARIQWADEQRQKAAEEQARLQAAAREQHEEVALEHAAELEAAGDKAGAVAVLEDALERGGALEVTVRPEIPKTNGLSERAVWKFSIDDALKVEPINSIFRLIDALALDPEIKEMALADLRTILAVKVDKKGPQIGGFLRLDEVAIGALVRGMQRAAQPILGPGVRIYEDTTEVSRG